MLKLPPSNFPSPLSADEDGILGFSYDLTADMLVDAYYHGIFPWPCEEETILWSSPRLRGVLFIEEFHVPHGFRPALKRLPFELRVDTAFDEVIDACAGQVRPEQEGTWITAKMRRAYKEFHQLGFAHSFETFDEHGTLAGGLYGVSLGGVFCGESMFFRQSGASKFALVKLAEVLRASGVKLLDTQMVTPLTALFGAREIPAAEYLALLEKYRDLPLDFA